MNATPSCETPIRARAPGRCFPARPARVASSMLSASCACPSSWRISIVTAVRPISCSGWRTVVSRGVVARLTSMSSKPVTDRSSGTRSPRAAASASCACPSSWRISIVTAVRPISCSGWRTVVSAGVVARLTSMSSKPVTDRSCGHPQPARRRRLQHPDRDLVVEADDGGRPRRAGRAARRPPARRSWSRARRAASAPGSPSTPASDSAARCPPTRSSRVCQYGGPVITPIRRWPSSTRCRVTAAGAGEVRRRDRHHAARHGDARVHHDERVAARGERLEVGRGAPAAGSAPRRARRRRRGRSRSAVDLTTASPASSSMLWPCSASVSAIDVTMCPK